MCEYANNSCGADIDGSRTYLPVVYKFSVINITMKHPELIRTIEI
jgi:hypothetical protein